MGEAKRKRMIAAAFEAVRETLWTSMGDAAERIGCERGDLLLEDIRAAFERRGTQIP
jgi:hypothetical protein